MILDFHSHHLPEDGVFRCINYAVNTDLELEKLHQPCSIGIHPWYIDNEDISQQIEILRSAAKRPEVRLIGECGLDRMKGPSLRIQDIVFVENIKIACDIHKPLVLHIVQCFNELFAIQKLLKPKVPMVVHGFNKSHDLAAQLLAKGFYISIGKWGMSEKGSELVKNLPLERLFLETDSAEISIFEIYEQVAKLKNISTTKLADQMMDNWLEITTL